MHQRLATLPILLLLAPGLAHAAPALTSSAPSADSVAQGSPTVVELTFSEGVEAKLSRITVKGADGKRVDANDVHVVSDDKHLAVSLKVITPGHYVVDWKVTSIGTDRTSGSYGFTVGQ